MSLEHVVAIGMFRIAELAAQEYNVTLDDVSKSMHPSSGFTQQDSHNTFRLKDSFDNI